MMKAVILNGVTPSCDIVLSEKAIPKALNGWVVIKIKAFGLNHSEQILRLNEIRADYIKKPVIPGIECAGEIFDPSDSGFTKGQKVIALMGGMGRSFDGSYAEYALLPTHHVFAVNTYLSWENLGAIPETYYTAWGSLFECLHLEKHDKLLVRGGTCALGHAAISIAKALGCSVAATTHKAEKAKQLEEVGADEIIIDDGSVSLKGKAKNVNKALELIGPKTVPDTLSCMEKGGIVCNTGILGKVFHLDRFDPIKDIPNGVYLTGFFSNSPSKATIDEMMKFITDKKITPKIGKIFDFSDIKLACELQDCGKADGKIVVMV